MLLQLAFTLLFLLLSGADLVVLATLLSWQESAASRPERDTRLWRTVVPATLLLLLLLLGLSFGLWMLWSPRGAAWATQL